MCFISRLLTQQKPKPNHRRALFILQNLMQEVYMDLQEQNSEQSSLYHLAMLEALKQLAIRLVKDQDETLHHYKKD